jgi:hypothetical protein
MDNKTIIIKGVGSSDTVFDAVTKVTRVSRARLLSDSRLWPVVEARMLSAIVLNRLGLVDTKIASMLNRKRSTVCKSRHAGEDLLQVSKTFKDKFNKVQTILNL